MSLENYRESIDAIDTHLLALINRRAELSKEIGRVKIAAGLPIADISREEQVLRTVRRDNPGDIDDEGVERIFRAILDESKRLQMLETEIDIAQEVNA